MKPWLKSIFRTSVTQKFRHYLWMNATNDIYSFIKVTYLILQILKVCSINCCKCYVGRGLKRWCLIQVKIIIYWFWLLIHWLLMGKIHCKIFLSEHFMKYSFRIISWNMIYFYFSIQHSLRMFLINKKLCLQRKDTV